MNRRQEESNRACTDCRSAKEENKRSAVKKLICFSALLAAIAAITTGCPKPEPEKEEISANFTDAILGYYWGEEEEESDSFVFELFNEQTGYGLDITFFSGEFEDALQALPDSGTYDFIYYNSSESGAKFTFDYAGYYNADDDDDEIEATGGSFSITRNGYNYSLSFNIELEGDKVLKGTYKGDIYPFLGGTENIEADSWAYAAAYEVRDGIWQIYMENDSGDEELELYLTVNTATGLTELPAGNYPMAPAAQKGVAGTAEPASVYKDDEDYMDYAGCWYFDYEGDSGFGLYAVPGKGSVNIEKDGDDYTIEFSYQIPSGKTISGSYTGKVYGDEDYTRAQTKSPKFRSPKRFGNK